MGNAESSCIRWLVAVIVAVLSGLAFVGAQAAQAKVGSRVTIGVFGDSVVESYTIPHYLELGLVPQLRTELAKRPGFEAGAIGLIPLSTFRWHFSKFTVLGKQTVTADAWILAGYASHGPDGLSGYSAIALSPQVTASTPIDGPDVGLLFTKFSDGGRFTVTAGSQTFSINTQFAGPPTPAEMFITVPPGTKTITVHGPATGTLVFGGVIVRKPVTRGRIGVEVENLGHMGHRLIEDNGPRILASLAAQKFDISVFLNSYIWEFAAAGGGNRFEKGYINELRARLAVVHAYGGLCLIVDPSPLPQVLGTVIARFQSIDRTVAREMGCAYSRVLQHLWNASTAVKDGMTLVDDVHPRAPGYRLMAQALVPELAKLVRDRVRKRGF